MDSMIKQSDQIINDLISEINSIIDLRYLRIINNPGTTNIYIKKDSDLYKLKLIEDEYDDFWKLKQILDFRYLEDIKILTSKSSSKLMRNRSNFPQDLKELIEKYISTPIRFQKSKIISEIFSFIEKLDPSCSSDKRIIELINHMKLVLTRRDKKTKRIISEKIYSINTGPDSHNRPFPPKIKTLIDQYKAITSEIDAKKTLYYEKLLTDLGNLPNTAESSSSALTASDASVASAFSFNPSARSTNPTARSSHEEAPAAHPMKRISKTKPLEEMMKNERVKYK